MTPTVTAAPDGAGAAEPAAVLEVEFVLEHAAVVSTATVETTAPNQRRHLSELRIISLRPFILSSGPHARDLAGAYGDYQLLSAGSRCTTRASSRLGQRDDDDVFQRA